MLPQAIIGGPNPLLYFGILFMIFLVFDEQDDCLLVGSILSDNFKKKVLRLLEINNFYNMSSD